MNRELPDVQTGFRKGRGTRDPNANNLGSLKNKKVPGEKHIHTHTHTHTHTPISALLIMSKPLNM